MTQATSNVATTGSNANLTATSTPIRIGSYHGPHTSVHSAASGVVNSQQYYSSTDSPSASQQQSSSVPSAVGSHLQLQTQHSSALAMGASNQSLGVAVGVQSANLTPPNSAGLRQSSAFDFKFMRRTSLKVLLPKLSSTDSLSNSPGPASPGIANWATDSRDKYDGGNQTDKTPTETSKLNRKESYKAQRKNYRREKKRVASELLNSLQDPAVIVLADWLKVRGTLKSWTKLWCVLKPGLLLIYKSPKIKSSHWVGTVLLTSCQVIERPSKKDGFCFKLFHPLEQSIWAPRGPDKESIGAVVQPLPTSYLIFRAPSQAAGKCWMDALELSLRCSALLLRSNSNTMQGMNASDSGQISHETQWSEADYERHFNEHVTPKTGSPYTHTPLQGDLAKRYQQYLSIPSADASKSQCSSDNSRSQTPILQALYTTMVNWERAVASASDFPKLKGIRKFYKPGKRESKDFIENSMSSAGDLSDASSVDFSPKLKLELHESLKLKKRRPSQFTKSLSLGSMLHSSTSSEDDADEVGRAAGGMIIVTPPVDGPSSPRPVSAPPFMFTIKDLDADSQNEGATALMSGLETDSDTDGVDAVESPLIPDELETPYVHMPEEEFSEQAGEQVEELAEENKSLIWMLVKQVRPGMDLSKVVLPTFILEPRSFLDKLSDSYYHADLLAKAVSEDDPFTRMKTVVKWYLSGFYKKPKGLKKPYNPILGETFRCFWEHEDGSRTYYIAEQVSHHPPVSAFYVTNRQAGFCISCSILAKSKFYGNSTSAVLEGVATLTLLPRGESYTLTTPYAHCKGILLGTLSMELGGRIIIDCENTGYKTELEFKLKPFLGGSDNTNVVAGKIKLGKETLATISGHWDTEMRMKDTKTSEESVLFTVNQELKQQRLKRHVVPIESQLANESERMWQLVSAAIKRDDQVGATEEKTVLEEAQRNAARERKATFSDWVPLHFQQDIITGQWIYKYADLRPWDPRSDVKQYEAQFKVLTKTRLQAPMVRTASIISGERLLKTQSKRKNISKSASHEAQLSDSSLSNDGIISKQISSKSIRKLVTAVDQMNKALDDHTRQLKEIKSKLERLQYAPLQTSVYTTTGSATVVSSLSNTRIAPALVQAFIYSTLGLFICFIFKWLFK